MSKLFYASDVALEREVDGDVILADMGQVGFQCLQLIISYQNIIAVSV